MSQSGRKRPVVQSYRRLGDGATAENPYPNVPSGTAAIMTAAPSLAAPASPSSRSAPNASAVVTVAPIEVIAPPSGLPLSGQPTAAYVAQNLTRAANVRLDGYNPAVKRLDGGDKVGRSLLKVNDQYATPAP